MSHIQLIAALQRRKAAIEAAWFTVCTRPGCGPGTEVYEMWRAAFGAACHRYWRAVFAFPATI